jgi:hypothetical protein
LWGFQIEEGATFPSTYIPTVASTVTRNADVLTYDDTDNIVDAAGTAYAEVSRQDSGAISPDAYFLSRGSDGRLLYTGATTEARIFDGTTVSASPSGTDMNVAPQALASTWGDALTAYINGDPDATPGSYDGSMGSGDIGVGAQNPNGTIRNVKIYNKELSEAQVGDL